MPKNINIALLGNPNTGKTSVFNKLTGLNQKTGNYPGITVEKKQGFFFLNKTTRAKIIDLPGTYSLNTTSMDESIAVELLMNKKSPDFPDVALLIADVDNFKRNLLLLTQIKDLEIPTILVINMADRIQKKGISINVAALEKKLNTKIVLVSCRKNTGIDSLKKMLLKYEELSTKPYLNIFEISPEYFKDLKKAFPNQSLYKLWLVITQDINFANVKRKKIAPPSNFKMQSESELKRLQQKETIKRYLFINNALKETFIIKRENATDFQSKLDKILLHPILGYVIFFIILLTIFQVIYDWSSIPMDFIDSAFAELSVLTKKYLPAGLFTNLLSEGIIPGLAGIVIFIPQIAFLFLFISILEETGYMSRVVFLMDKLLRQYGLSGKSVIPLMSGTACAIPAVMATRNIENWKERLVTILIIPFTTCSARLPIYLIIIGLVIPNQHFLGMNYQGLALMFLYFLGFFMALFSAVILNKIIKNTSKPFFLIEIPKYKVPLIRDMLIQIIVKTRAFVFEAGKIILAISILLWIMASFGINNNFKNAEKIITKNSENTNKTSDEINREITAYKLENSFIGTLGKTIEPIIKPLGYDWKIGIALLISFAAREVFVGALATIYNVGNDDRETIKKQMAAEKNDDGQPVFNLASGMSLIIFYALAMQCMSTLAIVRKETNSWKWPLIQLIAMTLMAYLGAFLVYQVLHK